MGRITVPMESRNKYDMKIRDELSGFPARLFKESYKAEIKQWWEALDQQGYEKYEVSFSKDINLIPLVDNEYLETRDSHDHILREVEFYPTAMDESNVGSNAGLLKVLMKIREEFHTKGRYVMLLADINIYLRIVKVQWI